MEQNRKKGQALARSQVYLSDLLQGVSPTVAVGEAFSSKNPEQAFRNLFALRRINADRIKNPPICPNRSITCFKKMQEIKKYLNLD